MERMHAELGEFAQGVQGNVRVFATMSAIAQFLPDDISAFIKKQQRVKVSIDERVSSEVVRGVEEGRADIGVAGTRPICAGSRAIPTGATSWW